MEFDYIPDILTYLKKSHIYFSEEKIPEIQQNIHQLVYSFHDSKSDMVEQFYNNYIHEVNEHMNYENETVFPYIEQLYKAYLNNVESGVLSTDYGVRNGEKINQHSWANLFSQHSLTSMGNTMMISKMY